MAYWNKNWVTLSGTYTGTVNKDFKVKISGISTDTLSFKWAVKNSDSSTWSAWTTVSGVELNTTDSLQDGMSVSFVRDAVNKYQINDRWIWNVYANLQLSANTGNYKRLIKIEDGDKDNLVAINSASGQVALIKDYESNNPSIETNQSIPISSSYDYVVNNKLSYVGGGPSVKSQVVGFDKTNSFGTPEPSTTFIAERSYETLNVIGTDSAVFDESVVLRGDANSYDSPDLLVGIDYGQNSLKCWNKDAMTTFTVSLASEPLQIRVNPAQHSSGRFNGVAILCNPENDSSINCIHLYTIGDDGNVFTRTRTIHLKSPSGNSNIAYDSDTTGGNWVDFLIVSTKADVTDGGVDYDLVVTTGGPKHDITYGHVGSSFTHYFDGYMFKYEDIDNLADGAYINGSDYVDITPKHNQSNTQTTDQYGSNGRRMRFGFYDSSETSTQSFVASNWNVHFIQKNNLALLGYDYNGENPIIGVTVKFEPVQYMNPQGFGDVPKIHNLFFDGAKFWYWIWATWIVPVNVSGSKSHPIMPHYRDWGQSNATEITQGHMTGVSNDSGIRFAIDNAGASPGSANVIFELQNVGLFPNPDVSTAYHPVPANEPLYAKGAGYLDGRKWGGFGSASSLSANADGNAIGKGQRVGFYYMRNRNVSGELKGTLRYIKSWQDTRGYSSWSSGSDTSESQIYVFPNAYSTLFTLFSNYSTAQNESVYTQKQMSFPQMNRPVISDSRYLIDVAATSERAVPADNDEFIQVTSKNDDQNFYKSVGIEESYNSEESNDIAANVPWLSFTISDLTEDWVGPSTTKKVFYKASLLYDGFQETALLPVVEGHNNGTDVLENNIKIIIKIDEAQTLSQRVSAVVLYRADDSSSTATNPDGLYRFVKEVKLSEFGLTNGYWEAIVEDDGTLGASYEATNGISETLVGLGVDYGINCALNGYMFVGQSYHEEFDDADNFIFRSQPGKFSLFDWSKDFVQLKFKPTALSGFMGKLFVYGKSQLAIVNPETLIIEDEIDGIGCVGPKAIYTTSTGLYWFDLLNIYNASPKITKIGTNIQTVATYGWSNLDDSVKQNAVAGYDGAKQSFQIYFKTGNDKRCWNFYEPTTRWDLWETPYEVFDSITGEDGKPILLCEDGRLVKYTAGTNKRDWQWESKKITMGDNTNYKKVRVIKSDADAMNRNNITVQYQTDINSDYQNGTDISDKYQKTGTVWKGTAKKVATADSKLRWLKVKLSGANSGSSNNRAHNIGIVFKPKKPK